MLRTKATARTSLVLFCVVSMFVVFCCATTTIAQSVYQSFPCKFKSARQLHEILVDILPDDSGRTHVVSDEQNNQVLVKGSPATLAMAAKILRNVDKPAVNSAAPNGPNGASSSL